VRARFVPPGAGSLKRIALAAGVALALVLAGCGAPKGIQAPIAPAAGDDELLAQDAEGTGSPVRAYFNDTYGETIEYNEPRARQNPYNTDKSLFKLIRGAHHTLDVSFYDLEEVRVAEALIAAKRRGVQVRVITDSDNLHQENGRFRESIKALKEAGITVRDDKRSAIMHDKFVIADQRVVWTGSTNATVRSLYWHNNNAITIRSEHLAGTYTAVFERYFGSGHFGPTDMLRGLLDGAGVTVGGVQMMPYFSPKGGGKAAVVAQLAEARKHVYFMTFSLTDSDVGDMLARKVREGLDVQGVMDRWLAAGDASLFDSLKRRGVKVLKDGNQALMHHKVILIDDDVVITGSFNYSQNAEAANNENFLIIRSRQIARAYMNEWKRILYAAQHNRPPYAKPRDPEAGSGLQ